MVPFCASPILILISFFNLCQGPLHFCGPSDWSNLRSADYAHLAIWGLWQRLGKFWVVRQPLRMITPETLYFTNFEVIWSFNHEIGSLASIWNPTLWRKWDVQPLDIWSACCNFLLSWWVQQSGSFCIVGRRCRHLEVVEGKCWWSNGSTIGPLSFVFNEMFQSVIWIVLASNETLFYKAETKSYQKVNWCIWTVKLLNHISHLRYLIISAPN